ncbi:kinase-like domain-containing protein [Rhizophagus irregularis DAOM 181602=DAOM 197198]|uniref:Kinase-like domain-containing protein n=1 Tax=Rhizophagus irregularis (strain DAOM 181602 / DAOM 197198 / MUCL 43194) TaxID=747089 RepID=A0A2P4QQM0_RHIID|nr:kinase-like domain-containing protein [Rhizophagus irregularis DAOM 181602=DAOM 197198]POG79957.1 kinase-like domain-containing protein [Rhizophagus irregularis DAOM 181602=DAOM 197198]|eukprot:XP_025186823.1 kinase-like domain-containing protein [Rhizophagus irregularis DAOM 181602=DAOM 197198]
MIIMPYYSSGDLSHYLSNEFYNIDWHTKSKRLWEIAQGLFYIHVKDIIHRDLHSGNIFLKDIINRDLHSGNILLEDMLAYIGDLGISKSAIEYTENNDERYGIIPYMAPEIFQGRKYTTASDIYSFGMIMWEFMTGRRPFWDRIHDTELIIEICDGLRPPIVTNAPEGYIELMKECWNSDPNKRPKATVLRDKMQEIFNIEGKNMNPTKIIKSSDIGPVATNNPGAIYKSRHLSGMIQSAMSTRSLRGKSITAEVGKRKFEDNQAKNCFDGDKFIKKIRSIETEDNGKIILLYLCINS